MAADPIHEYLDTRRKLDEATGRAERMVKLITGIAQDLRNWQRVTVGGAAGFPFKIGTVRDIDVRNWPSAEDIRSTVLAWHRARLDAQNAWERIPADTRSGLQPP